MSRKSNFERIDPITLRAAARLVRMEQAGKLTQRELEHCFLELIAMCPVGSRPTAMTLRRAATRLASHGNVGLAPGTVRLHARRASRRLQPLTGNKLDWMSLLQ